MCTSVPQMAVLSTRITTSPAPALGTGTLSSARPGPRWLLTSASMDSTAFLSVGPGPPLSCAHNMPFGHPRPVDGYARHTAGTAPGAGSARRLRCGERARQLIEARPLAFHLGAQIVQARLDSAEAPLSAQVVVERRPVGARVDAVALAVEHLVQREETAGHCEADELG